MKKIFSLLFIVGLFHFTGVAQGGPVTDKQTLANDELKTGVVSKLNLSIEASEKIVDIENAFYASIASSNKMSEVSEAEKKAKSKVVHSAHVLRRSKLMELPLNGRQMEDVIELSESIRRKYKL